MNLGGWYNYELMQDNIIGTIIIIHCVPLNDLREHELWESCWCNPVCLEEGAWSHNALDDRSSYENGRKLQ